MYVTILFIMLWIYSSHFFTKNKSRIRIFPNISTDQRASHGCSFFVLIVFFKTIPIDLKKSGKRSEFGIGYPWKHVVSSSSLKERQIIATDSLDHFLIIDFLSNFFTVNHESHCQTFSSTTKPIIIAQIFLKYFKKIIEILKSVC